MNNEFEFRFPAEPDYLRVLRDTLREALAAMGVAEATTDRVLLVMDEIASNAIEHGALYRQGEKPLRARVRIVEERGVFLQFHDEDMPSDTFAEVSAEILNMDTVPFVEMERGRGLFLIREFLSDLQVLQPSDGGMLLEGFLRE